MKTTIERRRPEGLLDYLSLVGTTFGVGYLPIAPGTWGSMVGVGIYLLAERFFAAPLAFTVFGVFGLDNDSRLLISWQSALVAGGLMLFSLFGFWAAGRAAELLGNSDPSAAVIDEVIGQLITFLFVPFGVSWPFLLIGFLLFRLFDIWKPYPIDLLQGLPGGVGICADDIVAGVYAGVCLSVIYAISLSV